MQKYIKYSVIVVIVVFAALGIMAILTKATDALSRANVPFLALASSFFLISMLFWIIPWVYLIKKNRKMSVLKGIIMGFSCVYGALTPLQVGSEALRAIKAKDIFGIPYKESVAGAMLIKGIKFFLLAVLASIVIATIIITTSLSIVILLALTSGFAIIAIAASLFLLPLNKNIGLKISKMFKFFAKKIKKFKVVENYFEHYANYLTQINKRRFSLVFLITIISLLCEFLALWASFLALNVFIDLFPLAVLFVIISVLERTPGLPRGIGLVETAGFIFLSIPAFSNVQLDTATTGAILILFDVVRLLVPTVFSFAVSTIKLGPVKSSSNN